MNIKVSGAKGAALDWLVARCEGVLNQPPGTCRDCKHHEERAITDSSEHVCHLSYMTWTGGGYFDDTPFGDGISVDYGRHQNCPINELTAEPYSTNWAQGGPIIERERIELCSYSNDGVDTAFRSMGDERGNYSHEEEYVISVPEVVVWTAWVKYGSYKQDGPTPLIAAMRCYVASKLGETVEVPEELL